MKSSTLYLAATLSLMTVICSCKKNNNANNNQTITVAIPPNSPYIFDLGVFGDEEGATITRQPTHYQVSTIHRIPNEAVTYEYKPALDFTGTDEVELKSMRGSDGASPNNKIIITTIKFTISN